MSWPLCLGTGDTRYCKDEAENALAGYAFGKTDLGWSAPRSVLASPELSAPPKASQRYKWGYQHFDCSNSGTDRFSIEDVLVTAAIDSWVGGVAIIGLAEILDDLNEALDRIPPWQTFWALPRQALIPPHPQEGTRAWWLWRTWALVEGLPEAGVALTHKTLHRKRPWLFPMLDNLTEKSLRGASAWAVIHDDLRKHETEFSDLEDWFADLARTDGGVPLTRLRIHDILLWGDKHGDREAMIAHGRAVLGRNNE